MGAQEHIPTIGKYELQQALILRNVGLEGIDPEEVTEEKNTEIFEWLTNNAWLFDIFLEVAPPHVRTRWFGAFGNDQRATLEEVGPVFEHFKQRVRAFMEESEGEEYRELRALITEIKNGESSVAKRDEAVERAKGLFGAYLEEGEEEYEKTKPH